MSALTSPEGVNVGPQPTVLDGASRNARVMGSPVWSAIR
jgi:hypothetical protein